MKLPSFQLDFRMSIPRCWKGDGSRNFAIKASSRTLTGFIITLYVCNVPVFNLVADKDCECTSPRKYPHEWLDGRIRWGFVKDICSDLGGSVLPGIMRTLFYSQMLDRAAEEYRIAHGPDGWSN